MEGSLQIHKSDATTRDCSAVIRLSDGGLAVYDTLPHDWNYRDEELWMPTGEFISPDIIVDPDRYNRVEKEDSTWNTHSPEALRKRAEERDDVDEDNLDSVV